MSSCETRSCHDGAKINRRALDCQLLFCSSDGPAFIRRFAVARRQSSNAIFDSLLFRKMTIFDWDITLDADHPVALQKQRSPRRSITVNALNLGRPAPDGLVANSQWVSGLRLDHVRVFVRTHQRIEFGGITGLDDEDPAFAKGILVDRLGAIGKPRIRAHDDAGYR
jgi:hypothetical protein